MTALIGWLGTLLLATAAIPQTLKVWREGHAKGLAWPYLLLLWSGFFCMGIFAILHRSGWPLIVSYSTQLCLFTLIIFRKKYPREP